MQVPSNLIPTRITELPSDPAPSSAGLMMYVNNGVTYKVPVSEVVAQVSGLGTMSTQNANAVAITGGTLSGVTVDGAAPYLNFTPSVAPAYQEGRVFYDSAAHTLCYFNDNTQMTVNIAQEQIVRVRNRTGVSIADGQVVYVSGATGNTPDITLALATSFTTADIIGVTTTTIAHNAFGYVTINGLVNGLDTSAYADGTPVFLSPSVPGGVTATEPVAPNYSIQVGVILRASPSVGTLLVSVQIVSTESQHIVGDLRLNSYTVATLPAAGTAGRIAYVTDGTAPTYLGTLTGGGAVKVPVFDNGTAWVAI